jgi:hypothetical protein
MTTPQDAYTAETDRQLAAADEAERLEETGRNEQTDADWRKWLLARTPEEER